MRILHLLDTLAPSESTWHILTTGPHAVQAGEAFNVCCLGRDDDAARHLRQAGVSVQTLGWSRWFDPRIIWNLRRALDEANPDLIHVWNLFTLRALAVVDRQRLLQVVYTNHAEWKRTPPWWDRALTDAVRNWSPWDSDRYLNLNPPQATITDRDTAIDQLTRPFRIVCAGWEDRAAGFRNALWAFDFLRYHYTNLRLDLVGVEDASGSLQRLAVGLELQDHVRFHTRTLRLSEMLADADIVWLPSVINCGADIAQEALRLGKPIVASDMPRLRSVLRGGSLGLLTPVGDVTALTQAAHRLLRDPDLRAHFATLGQQAAEAMPLCGRFAYPCIAAPCQSSPLAA